MNLDKIFDRFFSMKGRVVQRKDMPNFTMAKMRLAAHPDAKSAALKKLSKHECESIVVRVAENANTPIDVLEDLARHPSAEVRIALTENDNVPARILLLLAEDEQVDVRYSLAENTNTPLTVLSRLCDDDNPYVAERAKTTISRLRTSKYAPYQWAPFFRHRQRDIG